MAAQVEAVTSIESQRPVRMVVVAYLAIAVCLGAFLEKAIGATLSAIRWNDPTILGLQDWTLSSAIGYLAALITGVAVWMNPRLNKLSFEVAVELKRTTWPTADDTRSSTLAVVIFSVASAGILALFDVISSKVMTEWIPHFLNYISKTL